MTTQLKLPARSRDGHEIEFFVAGMPAPGGSKTAKLVMRKGGVPVMKNGRPLITMRDAGKGNADWRSLVSFYARVEMGDEPPFRGPYVLEVSFFMPRNKGHVGKAGNVLGSAPVHHTVKCDALKLARSTEDAMTGIVYVDDAQCVRTVADKRWTLGQAGARIVVRELTAEEWVSDDSKSQDWR